MRERPYAKRQWWHPLCLLRIHKHDLTRLGYMCVRCSHVPWPPREN